MIILKLCLDTRDHKPKYELQKAMMRFVQKAEKNADLILFIVDVNSYEIPDFAFKELKV